MTPARAMIIVHQVLVDGYEISAEPAEAAEAIRQFQAGLEAWKAGNGKVSLDKALGLRERGGCSPAKELAITARNDILRHLMHVMPEWDGLEPTVVARRMITEFDRYKAARWKHRDHKLQVAPDVEPFASFWRLIRSGARMPKAEQLRQILAGQIQSPV